MKHHPSAASVEHDLLSNLNLVFVYGNKIGLASSVSQEVRPIATLLKNTAQVKQDLYICGVGERLDNNQTFNHLQFNNTSHVITGI